MKINQYYYLIAGIRILCRIPFPVVIQKEAQEFLFPIPENVVVDAVDAIVTFTPVDVLPEVPEKAMFFSDHFYSQDSNDKYQVHYCLCSGESPYACAIWDQDKAGRPDITCYYLPGNEFRFSHSRMISDHIGMETMLLRMDCLIIHASLIRINGQGIFFTAPSGTGKSTQADLWKRYEAAEVLNGDRTAVRRENGVWRAYGLPYAGSSGIYRNENAQLTAVAVLRKAGENRIRKMGKLEIIQNLYPETTIHHWERGFIEKALSILTDLAGEVPFYFLECLPDHGAVEVLKEQIIR